MADLDQYASLMETAAALAWREFGPGESTFPRALITRELRGVLDDHVIDQCVEAGRSCGEPASVSTEEIDASLEEGFRRVEGIYLTPRPLADALAAPADVLESGESVMDLSCGTGSLLLAAARRNSSVELLGIEKQPALAVVAATRLVSLRRTQGRSVDDRILVGDGLDTWAEFEAHKSQAGLVLGNPPYIREKGNRSRFQALRARHDHLADYWGPRMDLQYLFFHRSLDYLRPGGWLSFLTSAYWVSATNAAALRGDLVDRARPKLLLEVRRAGVFEDAPGHHSLLSFFKRPADTRSEQQDESSDTTFWTCSVEEPTSDVLDQLYVAVSGGDAPVGWTAVSSESLDRAPWSPFVSSATRAWGDTWRDLGTPLGDLLEDRQGFVSGADSVNAWNQKHLSEDTTRGSPIFIYEGAEPPAAFGRADGTVSRPMLRGSALEPNEIMIEPPKTAHALYLDAPVTGEAAETAVDEHLGAYRPILERRREVKSGSMPWYRLHWPRRRSEQTGPKLVVARRAKRPAFALDLSASCVTSDCTYLVAPEDCRRPLHDLVVLMVLLNRPETERYLREFGKTKGELIEFYSEPLRSLPLPVERTSEGLSLNDELLGEAVVEQVEARVRELLASIGATSDT